MKILIEFDTDNAAFDDDNEAGESARILREMAGKIEMYGLGNSNIRDINGNTVGVLRREVTNSV